MLKFIRTFEKLDFRLRKISADIESLNSCLENDLCPTFLRYKMSGKRLQNFESYKHSQRMFLKEEVTFTTVEKEKIIREIRKLEDDLRSVIGFTDWIHISNKFIKRNKRAIKQVE